MLSLTEISKKHHIQWKSWKLEPRLPAQPTELLVYQKIHLAKIQATPLPQLAKMYQAHHL